MCQAKAFGWKNSLKPASFALKYMSEIFSNIIAFVEQGIISAYLFEYVFADQGTCMGKKGTSVSLVLEDQF